MTRGDPSLVNSYAVRDSTSLVVEVDGETVALADDEVRIYERPGFGEQALEGPPALAGCLELRVALFDYGAADPPEVYHGKQRLTERRAAKLDDPAFANQAVELVARNVLAEFRNGGPNTDGRSPASGDGGDQ